MNSTIQPAARGTLIGLVTFGNLPFTQLTVRSLRETTKHPVDFFIVVGKPGDQETIDWLRAEAMQYVVHPENRGFPASLNDIYDWAWPTLSQRHVHVLTEYDHLIIAGNDIVPYPGAVDALIDCAETTDYEWIASSQLDVKSLCHFHPEARQYFEGERYLFNLFCPHTEKGVTTYEPTIRPWELHTDFRPPAIEANAMRDCHNLCLFKRSVAEKIGYIDVNFFPAYFSDNDYNRRATIAGIKGCTLPHAAYFHFWSRTIHQGSDGSTPKHFKSNQQYYCDKWGGLPGHEQWRVPFNGAKWCAGRLRNALSEGVSLDDVSMFPSLHIPARKHERACLEYWKSL